METKSLKADLIELALMETLILCRKEYGCTGDECKQLELLADSAMLSLGKYSIYQIHWTRFGKLLIGLRSLALRKFEKSLSELFQGVLNNLLDT